ncbi:MAG: exonuclease domain-containing protein [Chitinophagales bacterium]
MLYAIVDIETTGGRADYHGITEIAVIVHDGNQKIDSFHTLLNPQQFVPEFIMQLTGITNEMVESAPLFADIAEELYAILKDKIFVAHNAGFDYAFLKYAFESHGYIFNLKKLCTVRLSKKVFPGLRSYNLGRLSEALHVQIHNRHRAMGDAAATAEIFSLIVQKDCDHIIEAALKRNSKEQHLPPHLDKNELDALPTQAGVYYFLNAEGTVIYVGKAKNIKSRVYNHFTFADRHGKENVLRNETHNVTYTLTGNELIALLLESEEIKRRAPKYNDAQKMWTQNFCVFTYQDQLGYAHLAIEKYNRRKKVLRIFTNFLDARTFLIQQINTYSLCPKLCHIQTATHACYNYQKGTCHGACIAGESPALYNARVQQMIASEIEDNRTYFIIGKGRQKEEHSIVYVENGHYLGFGFYAGNISAVAMEDLKDCIKWRPDNPDIQRLLAQYLLKHPEQKHTLAL